MNRNSLNFASRPVRVAVAVKIALAILAADVSLACAKVLLIKSHGSAAAAPVIAARPSIAALDAPARDVCRQVEVEVDEGYGVRGHVSRWVCRKAL